MYVLPLTVTLTEGGIGIFSFAVLAFFRLVFPFFGFGVIAVCRFSVFRHLVFSFREKYQHILGFDIRCGFRSFLTNRFLFDLSSNYRPPLILNSH